MTPLHFRAWLDDRKEMVPFSFASCDGEVCRGNKGWDDCFVFDKAKIMQYTGLQDRLGKEIFEGDIVEGYTVCGLEAGEVVFGKYVTDNKANEDIMAWCFSCKERYHALDPQCTWEIIGNIHENPDLL